MGKSKAYAKGQDIDKELVIAKCRVHFRPKEDWNGKDFGFDWMRVKDTGPLGDNNPYEDIVARQYLKAPYTEENLVLDLNKGNGQFERDEALYEKLEGDYFGRNNDMNRVLHYYPSWLSLHPAMASSDPDHPYNGEAQLRLYIEIVENGEAPDRLEFEDNDFYEITPKTISNLKGKGSHWWSDGEKTTITVKCKKPCPFDQMLKVYAMDKKSDRGRLSGKLRVWSNTSGHLKKLKVLFVHVTTPIPVIPMEEIVITSKRAPASNTSGTGATTKGKIVPLPPRQKAEPPEPVAPTPPESNNDGPTGDSRNQRELITRYLHQALISAEVSDEKLSLKGDANFDFGGCYRHAGGIIGYYEKVQGKPNPQKPKEGFEDLTGYLYRKLQETLENKDQYAHYKRVFFIDDTGGGISGDTGNKLSPDNGYCVGDNQIIFKDYSDPTVTHEILHSLGLPHSFTNSKADKNAFCTYEYNKTENIMDYSSDRYSLWHWQWVIANKNVK